MNSATCTNCTLSAFWTRTSERALPIIWRKVARPVSAVSDWRWQPTLPSCRSRRRPRPRDACAVACSLRPAASGHRGDGWSEWATVAAALLIATLWYSTLERQRTAELLAARHDAAETTAAMNRLQQVMALLECARHAPSELRRRAGAASRSRPLKSGPWRGVDRRQPAAPAARSDLRNVGDPEGRRAETRWALPFGSERQRDPRSTGASRHREHERGRR